MHCLSEQGLHFSCPCQLRTFLNQTLQVADLMRQKNLAHFRRRIELRLPTVAHPNFCFALAHTCTVPQVRCKLFNHIVTAAGQDQVIHALLADKNPLPPIVAVYARMGFITADDSALANLLTDLFRFAEHGFPCALEDRHRATFAQRQVEEFAAQLDEPFKANMMFVMQCRYGRFQTRSKIASRFQAFWQVSALRFAAARADDFIIVGFQSPPV